MKTHTRAVKLAKFVTLAMLAVVVVHVGGVPLGGVPVTAIRDNVAAAVVLLGL